MPKNRVFGRSEGGAMIMQKFRKPVNYDNEIHKEGVLEKKEHDQMILFRDLQDCSGCGACIAICPQKAIKMVFIHEFCYPMINKNLCVECKRCMKICPFK